MKKLRERIMYGYYLEWKDMKHKDKGRHVEEVARVEQMVPSTVYRWFKRFKNGKQASVREDKGTPRFEIAGKRITIEQKREWVRKLAGLKIALLSKEGKTADTESLNRALHNRGEMPLIPVSTMNRWMDEEDMSVRKYKRVNEAAKYRLMSRHSNECWVVDSTSSELYYLRDKEGKRLIKDAGGILTDKNHREEILTKRGFSRLLLFCFVDLFSGAFWYRAYVTPGESSAIWLRAILEAMMPKSDPRNVFRGIPKIIYTDKGSGIGNSEVIKEVCGTLGIKIITHAPGNAKAKAKVESRIGKIKSRIEKWMSVENIGTIDRYNELAEEFIIAENINNGFYQVWSQIHKTPEWLREFDPTIRDILAFGGQRRIVNARGCIPLANIEYYVSGNLKDDYVDIYTLPDGTLKAIDRHQKTYDLVDPSFQGRYIGEYRPFKKTALEQEYDLAKAEGKRLRNKLNPEDFIRQAPENVVIFDKKGITPEIDSPLSITPFQSAEDAWYQIVTQTGYGKGDLPGDYVNSIDQAMLLLLSQQKGIPRELVFGLIDEINNSLKEEVL